MTETTTLRGLLLPEMEHEFATTRRVLLAVPDGKPDFRCHEKSMPLNKLAGHVAELPTFISMILTSRDLDLRGPMPRKPYVHETTMLTVAEFDSFADTAMTDLKNTSDQTFEQNWKVVHGDHKIFSGSRYMAYRSMGMNHLIHHRAQLGVYLRLLGVPVPKSYGPTADEQ